jgi:hypothetical protein
MRKSGGFMQNGFTDFKKWSEGTGYEQHDGKLIGTSFQQKLFDLPANINITDPYKLKTNSLLLSLCNNSLHNKGIDLKKMFSIDPGKTDFFGHTIQLREGVETGVCGMR